MITVQQLLVQNVRPVCAIAPDATVFDAIAKMAEQDIGSLLVMEGDKLVGIITERHYARNVMLKGNASPTTPVRDIMERRVICARPDQTVEQCMALMSEKRVRHLPVLEKKGDRHRVDRRSRQKHHQRSAIHHRPTRAPYPRIASRQEKPDRSLAGDARPLSHGVLHAVG